MIGLIAGCLLSLQPITADGTEESVWFVGDRPPDAIGNEHELCSRETTNGYWVIQPLMSRPEALVVGENNIWFVEDGSGVELYKVKRAVRHTGTTSGSPSRHRAQLVSFLESDQRPTDLVLIDEQPIIAFGGLNLDLYRYIGNKLIQLPTLEKPDAHVASLNGKLIAASPEENEVSVWYLQDGKWRGGDIIELEDQLVDFIVNDDWPLLITKNEKNASIIGLQQSGPIGIATFKVPRGRWGVVPSPDGLTVVGVERNGRTTVLDIGWPSGEVSEEIVLNEKFAGSDSVLTTVTLIIPLILFIVIVTLTRRHGQNQQNNTSNSKHIDDE
ncbi:MAG: hypothetical protein QF718_09355 [Phycisphaerales bacterium]|nr:hypothetical protein [Phycisphaerales bacterium]